MNPFPNIVLYCPHCSYTICRSGEFSNGHGIFDGRFYVRFCRPILSTVYASLEGARCCSCHNIVGGVFSFIGNYGYFFLSGPFANFAEMHEFYGPVHLYPGDEETVRSFVRTNGWNFPHVLEYYLLGDRNQQATATGSNISVSMPFPDSYLNFANRHSLYRAQTREAQRNDDPLLDAVLESLLDSTHNIGDRPVADNLVTPGVGDIVQPAGDAAAQSSASTSQATATGAASMSDPDASGSN